MKNDIEKNTNTFDGFVNKAWACCEPIFLDCIKVVITEAKELVVFKFKVLFENLKNK